MKKHVSSAVTQSALLAALLTGAPFALAQQAPAPTPTDEPKEDDLIVLSPFVVDAEQDRGYQATATLAGTRLRTDLADVGSAISVLTKELITDVGGYNNQTVLSYAVNTEIGGPRGNFSGANRNGSEGHITESANFSNPNGNTRVRGLTGADNTRDFFLSDIPWDGYNIGRVDLQRGPNAILFGLGSPAGIINAATNRANFTNKGSVEALFDKYGTYRGSFDYNYTLIKNQLGVRVALVDNNQKFQQDPAFRHDRRAFGAGKWSPAVLNQNGMKFDVYVNAEHGEIDSNNPRSVPPEDRITMFWKSKELGGVAGRTFNVFEDVWVDNGREDGFSYDKVTYDEFGRGMSLYANSKGVPTYSEFGITTYGARANDGSIITTRNDQNNGGPAWGNARSTLRALRPVQQWAAGNGALPYSGVGAYRNEYLTDTSVFDYYNKLIDGENKREFNRWNAWNVEIGHSFFNNMLGYNFTAYREHMKQGAWSALGWEGNGINLDINEYLPSGARNPDVGRPFVGARTGGGAWESESNRRAYRMQVFGEYDFVKQHGTSWWTKVLGKQQLSGVLSDEEQKKDDRSMDLFDFDLATRSKFGSRAQRSGDEGNQWGGLTSFRYYIGGDVRSRVGARGTNLSNLTSPFINWDGGTVPINFFDNTWKATGVNPGDSWSNPLDPNKVIHSTYTQANNPANYVGWTSMNAQMLTIMSQGMAPGTSVSAKDYLTTSATLSSSRVKSRVGVYQGTFWNHSIVGIYGVRQDRARSYNFNTSYWNAFKNVNPVTGGADLRSGTYNFSNPQAFTDVLSTRTKNWSVMAHLNRLVPNFDPLPVNIRLYYNEGENFQPAAGRTDMLGRTMAPPQGNTIDKSIMVSTKDDRFSVRLTKYETTIKNATSTDSEIGNLWAIQQVLGFGSAGGSAPTIIRDFATGRIDPVNTGYVGAGGDANKLLNSIVPAWLKFEKDLRTKFPDLVEAWLGKDTIFGTDLMDGPVPNAVRPSGSVFTEDSVSEGYELEFTANPTKNWRIAVNGSRTKAVRDNVPGAYGEAAAFIDNALMNTDAGLAPMWWPGNAQGLRAFGPYPWFYRPEYLKILALNGQSAGEIRKYRGNLITSYDFDEGRLKGFGVGGAARYEDKSVIGYAPMVDSAGILKVNANAPFFSPSDTTFDLWFSYRRKLTDKVNWKIQLNLFNVGGKNKLVPIAAGVDPVEALKLDINNLTPGTKVPMKATGFSIKEGMAWQVTNTFEF
jgi:outer membrane receptor protein involved in Fe transport